MKLVRLLAVAALLAIGVLVWGFTAPERSLESLREAARNGDTERLEEIVDFEAVRENAKSDVADAVATAFGGDPNEADYRYGILGGYGDRLVEGIIDRLVTAESLAAFASGQAAPDAITAAEPPTHEVEWAGVRSFRLVFDGEEEENLVFLEFALQGARWRLVRMGIPEAAL